MGCRPVLHKAGAPQGRADSAEKENSFPRDTGDQIEADIPETPSLVLLCLEVTHSRLKSLPSHQQLTHRTLRSGD